MNKQMYRGWSGREASLTDVLSQIPIGWHPLVTKLVDDLFTAGWDGQVFQVKEKFGTLRFYIGGGTPEIHELVHKAEDASANICQDCGAPGQLRNEPFQWVRVLCDTHANQRGYGKSRI